jgi:hypothetical protein
MILLDKMKEESTQYKLDFTGEEIEKGTPLLLQYLQEIRQDFEKEQATSS